MIRLCMSDTRTSFDSQHHVLHAMICVDLTAVHLDMAAASVEIARPGTK